MHSRIVFGILAILILSLSTVVVVGEEPNVGLLRIISFQTPSEVAPSSVFPASIEVEYALHGRPDNATIRAAIYEGTVNFSDPLWQSEPKVVSRGGDEVWTTNLTAPPTEGYFKLTAFAYFLDQGGWRFFNNSINGPSFSQVTIQVVKTANLEINLGASGVPVIFDNQTNTRTSPDGEAQIALSLGEQHNISILPIVQLQNSTRLVFSGWADGSKQTEKSFLLTGNLKLVGSYTTQYLLQVYSLSSSHSSWYEAGSVAEVTTPTSIPMDFPLNLIGLKYNFNGWTGNINAHSNQLNVTMNGPNTLNANYSTDYSPLIILVILAAVAIATMFMLHNRRSRKLTSALCCNKCGEPIEDGWVYCNHCGAEADLATPSSPKD